MYARAAEFSFGAHGTEIATKALAKFRPLVERQPGFVSGTFLSGSEENETSGDFLSLTVWESRKAAEAATDEISPLVEEFVKEMGYPGSTPTYHYYEVLEPREMVEDIAA